MCLDIVLRISLFFSWKNNVQFLLTIVNIFQYVEKIGKHVRRDLQRGRGEGVTKNKGSKPIPVHNSLDRNILT